ncbi:unnamed protein product [Ectocarpus sp. CCAP 1310/34]|nr:unnamed protein product [Ectocarpus sp. CCAP 1310/34]
MNGAVALRQGAGLSMVTATPRFRCVRPISKVWAAAERWQAGTAAVRGRRGGGAADDGGHELSTHVSSDGVTPRMVDVGDKATTRRTATARSRIRLPPDVTSKMETVGGEVVGKKGPVFTTAIIAGVQAAKRTSELIPFCHPLPIEDCRVELSLKEGGEIIEVDCTVRVTHKTGVEMEAMMGASVAALTVYDMLKGLSHNIVVEDTALVSKTGGKRDFSRTTGEEAAAERR